MASPDDESSGLLESPPDRQPAVERHSGAQVGRLAALGILLCAAAAHAAQLGNGLISYAQPIILFLGVGAVVVALVGAVFKPELVKGAVWAAVILVVIFFILKNTSSLQAAVQAG
jgi:hypothetical protein